MLPGGGARARTPNQHARRSKGRSGSMQEAPLPEPFSSSSRCCTASRHTGIFLCNLLYAFSLIKSQPKGRNGASLEDRYGTDHTSGSPRGRTRGSASVSFGTLWGLQKLSILWTLGSDRPGVFGDRQGLLWTLGERKGARRRWGVDVDTCRHDGAFYFFWSGAQRQARDLGV